VSDLRRLFDEVAVPRRTGSTAHARVRAVLTRELRQRGFVVLEQPFAVHPPGRLAGPYLAGGMLAASSVLVAALAALPPPNPSALLAGALGVALLLCFGVLVASIRHPPLAAVNLIAVRPQARVKVWLAAHYDSKGQPLSMFSRIVAGALSLVGACALAVLAATRLSGTVWDVSTAALVASPGLVGGMLLLGNRVTDGSPGALDNATALVTVFSIIDRLPPEAAVGVLLPDAEEFGLLGAKALVNERANLLEGTAVLNFDGIDDRGSTIGLVHRAGPVSEAVTRALGAKRRRLLPVVVDGWELARRAAECVTIMRGDWRTSLIVHTPRDEANRLTLEGSTAVAAAVAGALQDLLLR